MPTTVKQMLEAANTAVPKIAPARAKEIVAKGDALVVDMRVAPEVQASGKLAAPNKSPHRGCDIAAVDGGDVGGGLERQRLVHKRLSHILRRDFAAEQIAAHIVFLA